MPKNRESYTRIMYEVDDGYVGKSRPRHVDIPNDDLDECETNKEREDLINEYVEEDFKNNISWYITGREGKYA